MLNVIFSSDHEIHGNGDGNPAQLIVAPTDRMMAQFEKYGAKLTIFADVAEIGKFKEYYDNTGQDAFSFEKIVRQLQDAIRRQHDVQLHVHSSYYQSEYDGKHWEQAYEEYDLSRLSRDRLNEIISEGKGFLEGNLKTINPDYVCNIFRAANWSMMPSHTITRVLIDNGFVIDSSVFKWGKRSGLVNFDYSQANDALVPWPASTENVCLRDDSSKLFEVPIYTEHRSLIPFISLNRLYRVLNSRLHPLSKPPVDTTSVAEETGGGGLTSKLSAAVGRHAFKMDFNQCTGMQLIEGLLRAERKYQGIQAELPFVLIGHSKLFTKWNEWSLAPFLKFVAANPHRFRFGKYSDIDLEAFRSL